MSKTLQSPWREDKLYILVSARWEKKRWGEKKTSTTLSPFKNYTVIEWTQLHTKKHTFSANQYKKRQWHLFRYEIDATSSPQKNNQPTKEKLSSRYSCLNYLQVVTQGNICEWTIGDKMPGCQECSGAAGQGFVSADTVSCVSLPIHGWKKHVHGPPASNNAKIVNDAMPY